MAASALAATVLAAMVGAAFFAVKSRTSGSVHAVQAASFSPEIFEAEGYNSRDQLAAHGAAVAVCLGAAAALALLSGFRSFRKIQTYSAGLVMKMAPVLGLGALAVMFGSRPSFFIRNASWYAAAMGAVLAALVIRGWFRRWIGPRAAWVRKCLLAVLLVAITLPGLMFKHNLTRLGPKDLSFSEGHFSLMPGTAGRLAAGLRPFTEVKMWYGVVLPTFFGIAEKNAGPLNLGQYITIIQSLQILFLVLAAIAFYRWRPRDPWYFATCLLLLAPWVQTCGEAVLFPNLSAWRNMNLATGALAIVATRNTTNEWRAAWLGASVGFGVLYNFETGVALGFACMFDLILSNRRQAWRTILQAGAIAVASATGAALLFAVAGRVGLGVWPFSIREILKSQFVVLGSGDFGGRPMFASGLTIIAAGVFLHAGFVLVSCCTVWRHGRLTAEGSAKASIAVFLIIWERYFINRPQDGWYLWGILFLYSFLLPDYFAAARHIRARWIARRSWRSLGPLVTGSLRPITWRDYALLTFAFLFIMPFAARADRHAFRQIESNISSVPPSAQRWSGVWLQSRVASALTEKVKFLSEQGPAVVYFAANTFTIPQSSRRYPMLPVQDAYVETALRQNYEQVVAAVVKLQPPRILFEPDDSRLFFCPEQRQLFARLKKDVARGYAYAGAEHGWEIWDRATPAIALP